MSKYRVLLDEKLEHHARPLLNDVGIKVDVVRPKTGNLIKLLQAKPYNALIVRERVRVPLEVMETAPLSLKIIGVLWRLAAQREPHGSHGLRYRRQNHRIR